MVRDNDKGYKKLLANINKTGKGIVEVGVFALEGAAPANKSPQLTVLDIATFNEYGLGCPERSFIRAYVDENKDKVNKWIKVLATRVLAGELTVASALDLLGIKIQGEIQKRIADGIDPPNKPSTIKRKGSDKPLIDTGQLRSSITYKVREK